MHRGIIQKSRSPSHFSEYANISQSSITYEKKTRLNSTYGKIMRTFFLAQFFTRRSRFSLLDEKTVYSVLFYPEISNIFEGIFWKMALNATDHHRETITFFFSFYHNRRYHHVNFRCTENKLLNISNKIV